jgi:putative endonuclease
MTKSCAFVYLLRCSDTTLYCGWTFDVERRLAAHGSGKASKYTASRLPVQYAAVWRADDSRHARRLEAAVKRLKRPAKERLVAGSELEGAERVA